MRYWVSLCILSILTSCGTANVSHHYSFDPTSKNALVLIGVSTDPEVDNGVVALYDYDPVTRRASGGNYLGMPTNKKFRGNFYGIAELTPGTHVIGYASVGVTRIFFGTAVGIRLCYTPGSASFEVEPGKVYYLGNIVSKGHDYREPKGPVYGVPVVTGVEDVPLTMEDRRADAQGFFDSYGKIKARMEPLQTKSVTFGFGPAGDDKECPATHW